MGLDIEGFITERRYLKNVTHNTERWYKGAFIWLEKYCSDGVTPERLKSMVIGMRQQGLKGVTVNCQLRAINAYLKWSGYPTPVPKLKEEVVVLPVFTRVQVQKLMLWKPKKWTDKRLHAIIATLVDAGLRFDELLSLRREDVNFDNRLFKIRGKGQKERMVPFSQELRRTLFKYLQTHEFQLLFPTSDGLKLMQRNIGRDVKLQCKKLGFTPPRRTIHAFRHTFALNYVREGGSVFHLQRVLGHATLEMTMRYVHLQTEDLLQNHRSLLAS
jgi:integrase/recombinase XerD